MLSVQTNLGANTALKNLNTNTVNMNNSMNKLSSGFRINSAADDAAGFAVSSKLDSQSMRLKAASLNATQAQAMVKMADAGVNEIQNMVNRIQTLATQASSANNQGELGKLDAERLKLESAIDKIANGTNFNGINLLNGQDAAKAAVTGTLSTAGTGGDGTSTATGTVAYATTGTSKFTENASFNVSVDAAGLITKVTSNVDLHAVDGTLLASAGDNLAAGTGASITNGTTTGTTNTSAAVLNTAVGLTITATNGAAVVAGTATLANTVTGGSQFQLHADATTAVKFQVGANNNSTDQLSVSLTNKYTSTALGLGGTGNLLSQAAAQTYMTTAKNALNTVVSQRADLGATQNQIGFIQSNLATSIEQTTASVSAIRDTDMAAQMANFTKNKILSQVGTSMLAQANQAAQNVMSLFR
ncbi:MAG: flagellar protein [Zetaproteobacteria bacterium]|nr:flagellar protein [Zetaproteobacteria bacterium]